MELAFSGGGLDRAADRRGGDDWQKDALVLPVWRGKVCLNGDRLVRLAPGHPALADAAEPVLLGFDGTQAVAARDISAWTPPSLPETQMFFDPTEQVHPDIEGGRFVELRGVMSWLSPIDAELAATARALTGWHVSHRFCAACGQPSQPRQSGWQRVCPACGTAHFPRTDPVVIMLITHGDRALIGRSPGWPEGMYSCLAGFIEPGETIEAAVRREVLEETGIRVGPVRYAISQPWPFPSQLMIGLIAEVDSEEARPDQTELEAVAWLTRDQARAVLAASHPDYVAPPPSAIAHRLIRAWVEGFEA